MLLASTGLAMMAMAVCPCADAYGRRLCGLGGAVLLAAFACSVLGERAPRAIASIVSSWARRE